MFTAFDPAEEITVISLHDPAIDRDADGCDPDAYGRSARSEEDEATHLRYREGAGPARWTLRALPARLVARITDGSATFRDASEVGEEGPRGGPAALAVKPRIEVHTSEQGLEAFRHALVRVDGFVTADGQPVPLRREPTGVPGLDAVRRADLDRWFGGPMTAVAVELGNFALSANRLRGGDRRG